MTGAYTGITGLGALTSLDVQTTTGTAINDQNQASITLVSRGTALAWPVDPAVVIPV
jgi:hypothetical protein